MIILYEFTNEYDTFCMQKHVKLMSRDYACIICIILYIWTCFAVTCEHALYEFARDPGLLTLWQVPDYNPGASTCRVSPLFYGPGRANDPVNWEVYRHFQVESRVLPLREKKTPGDPLQEWRLVHNHSGKSYKFYLLFVIL